MSLGARRRRLRALLCLGAQHGCACKRIPPPTPRGYQTLFGNDEERLPLLIAIRNIEGERRAESDRSFSNKVFPLLLQPASRFAQTPTASSLHHVCQEGKEAAAAAAPHPPHRGQLQVPGRVSEINRDDCKYIL